MYIFTSSSIKNMKFNQQEDNLADGSEFMVLPNFEKQSEF